MEEEQNLRKNAMSNILSFLICTNGLWKKRIFTTALASATLLFQTANLEAQGNAREIFAVSTGGHHPTPCT